MAGSKVVALGSGGDGLTAAITATTAALRYLQSHGLIDPRLAQAFFDAGPLMVRCLHEHTPVRFRPIADFPDYHAEFPGGNARRRPGAGSPAVRFRRARRLGGSCHPSPYYTDPRLSIADTPLGQARPEPSGERQCQCT